MPQYVWCETKNIKLDKSYLKQKRWRCPKCKKRFEIFITYCCDCKCEAYIWAPKHKRRIKLE